MAKFLIKDYIDIGTIGEPTGATWEVALDEEFTNIIDSTVNDPKNILEWKSPLPKKDDPNSYYIGEVPIYVRVKLHSFDATSPWYICKNNVVEDYTVNYIQGGKIIDTKNISEIGRK